MFAECGGTLAGSMLREGLIDEIYHFIAPKILNDNTGQSCFNGNNINKISESEKLMSYYVKQIGPDMLVKYKVL